MRKHWSQDLGLVSSPGVGMGSDLRRPRVRGAACLPWARRILRSSVSFTSNSLSLKHRAINDRVINSSVVTHTLSPCGLPNTPCRQARSLPSRINCWTLAPVYPSLSPIAWRPTICPLIVYVLPMLVVSSRNRFIASSRGKGLSPAPLLGDTTSGTRRATSA